MSLQTVYSLPQLPSSSLSKRPTASMEQVKIDCFLTPLRGEMPKYALQQIHQLSKAYSKVHHFLCLLCMTENSHLQDVVAVDSARLPGYIILFGGGLPPLKKMYCRDHEKGEEHTQTHRQTRQVGELILLHYWGHAALCTGAA